MKAPDETQVLLTKQQSLLKKLRSAKDPEPIRREMIRNLADVAGRMVRESYREYAQKRHLPEAVAEAFAEASDPVGTEAARRSFEEWISWAFEDPEDLAAVDPDALVWHEIEMAGRRLDEYLEWSEP